MDFTYLLLIAVAVLAAKSNLFLLAVGILVILLLMAKDKYTLGATLVGGVMVFATSLDVYSPFIILGGLLVVLYLVSKAKPIEPQGYGG